MNGTPKRMTRKRLANEILHISEKTARELSRTQTAFNLIETKLNNGQLYEQFIQLISARQKNKKNGISYQMICELSKMDAETLNIVVRDMIAEPDYAKKAIQVWIPDVPVKITVTLPSSVNEILKERAHKAGLSRAKYLELLLTLIAQAPE